MMIKTRLFRVFHIVRIKEPKCKSILALLFFDQTSLKFGENGRRGRTRVGIQPKGKLRGLHFIDELLNENGLKARAMLFDNNC